MASAEDSARADVSCWREDPTTLAGLELGRFDEVPLRSLVVRSLLASRVPPALLAPLKLISPGARLLAAYRYWRGVRPLVDQEEWLRLTRGTTILLYHAVGGEAEPASRFIVPKERLERQLRWLERNRPLIGLDELIDCRLSNRLPPAGSVVVTFDDGYADNGPVLRELDVPATIFLVTQSVGGRNDWDGDGSLSNRSLLSWSELGDLARGQVRAGAHTRTHPKLSELGGARLEEEIGGSKDDLEKELGVSARTFAYPFGAWNADTTEAAARAGFACACTVRPGRNDAGTPLHELRRVEIFGTDSWVRFRLTLALGDRDLLGRLSRRLRRKP